MTRKPELETALELRCVAKVEARGGLALKLQIPGVRGFPDRTVMLPETGKLFDYGVVPARSFFAEFKRQKTGAVSVQQHKWKRQLEALGFKVYLVDTDAQFDSILEEWA